MPRKFKLSVKRKYAWKSKKAVCNLTVDHFPVPPETVSVESADGGISQAPQSLIVSLPLPTLLSAEASSLSVLQRRVAEASALPPGTYKVITLLHVHVHVYCRMVSNYKQ